MIRAIRFLNAGKQMELLRGRGAGGPENGVCLATILAIRDVGWEGKQTNK